MRKVVGILAIILMGCAQGGEKASNESSDYKGLGKESVSAATLAKFQAPPLPPEMSRKIQSYLDIRAPGLGMLSQDKKKLFFGWSITGTAQVFRLDQPKGFPVQMTGGEDQTGMQEITPDGRWIILSRDRNGEENPGLYLQSVDGGPLKKIQHKEKVQTFFEFVTRDGKFIYYRANDVKPDSFAVYRYNVASGSSELIFSKDGYWYISDFQDDGRLILSRAITNTASEHFEWNPKTQELEPIIGQNEKEDYSVRYTASKGTYLVLSNKGTEFKRLYQWNKQVLKPVTGALKWDVESFTVSPDRQIVLYSVNEGGTTKTHALSGKTWKKIEFPEFPGADHVIAGAFSFDSQNVMLGVVTATGPRVSYSYNFKTGLQTQWVLPGSPEVDTRNFARAQLEYFTAKDGTKIPMFVRRPPQCENPKLEKPCPVVVHFHGGPEAQSVAGFSVMAQMFVDEGFVFVDPNVRGSDGYGKTWLHMDDGPLRLNVIGDIEDAAISIKKNWTVKGVAPKVGIMGWSYGGYSTLVGMTKFAGSFDAGVSLVGMSNLVTFLQNTAPYRRQLRIPEYGDPEKDKEALEKLSAMTYLHQIKAPLMIIQGATDPRVPVGEAIQIHQALQKKGIPSQLIIFADEGHGTGKRSNRVFELGHAVNFMKQNLK